jgi:YesN/AraC family two-component response regulator
MPGKDGFEVASLYTEYKNLEPDSKTTLVALTAFGLSDEFEKKLRESGFSDYLMKPVRKEYLYKKIVSIVHNISEKGFTKIAAFIDEEEERDFDFSLLDNDFKEYLPTYLTNKIKETYELKAYVEKGESENGSAICHKILGTAKSFGLFKIDREIEETQCLIKDNLSKNYEEVISLVDSSIEHLEVLKEMFPN